MAVADQHGLPVSVHVESATPHEVTLAESTLAAMFIPDAPQNLIGDNAYDSDPLDAKLRSYWDRSDRSTPKYTQEHNAR